MPDDDHHKPDPPPKDAPPKVPANRLPDDVLPAVEAPGAGFILQLFFIPMIIVGIIVMVWLMFHWLAHMGSTPSELVKGLRRGGDKSWQDAGTLADLLRNPQYDHLKYDHALAGELAETLETQIDDGGLHENGIKLRVFICRALGEFRVDDGLPALLKAATTERDATDIEPPNDRRERTLTEIDVRRAALEAVAVMVKNVGAEEFRDNGELLQVLDAAASERGDPQRDGHLRDEMRSTAAYVLGVIGGEGPLDRLHHIAVSDRFANARYNAATGLARHGDVRALPVLLEMLDPSSKNAVETERYESGREWKQALVNINGVRAAELLVKKNTTDDLGELKGALAKLAGSQSPRPVRNKAKEALLTLRKRLGRE